MNKLNDRKKINLFIAICSLVYFTSYLTRKNYDAALVEIYTSMDIPKTLASLASTGAVITYGAGQLLSGVLGDKLKPRNIIFCGLIITSICNILMPLAGNIYPMIAIWCVNGLAQAMMWPPLVKIMSETLDTASYKKAVLYVTVASSIATILIYLLIPLCIQALSWKLAFYISSVAAAAVCAIWMIKIKGFERITGSVNAGKKQATESNAKAPAFNKKYLLASGIIPIAICIVLQGTLRDGVTTWMPTIVTEVFSLDTSVSILSTVALPLLGIFSSAIAQSIEKKIGNEVSSSAVFFAVSLVCCVLLVFTNSAVIISVLLMAIITACMHGINLMLVCEVPNYFAKFNKVSTVSGILNSFTYLGSAVSIYGIAVVAEKFNDWNVNFKLWAAISALGILFCMIALGKWKKFRRAANEN
ncbi:MAG: MFS transporter [Clostridia bacterium]|nr:MFS transporter [Clostridia bacterium]